MTHTVVYGDTLTKLSIKYGVSVADLVDVNGIKNKDVIHVGDVLRIPVKNKPSNTPDYAALGQQVERVLDDIEALPSFRALEKML